VEGLEDALLRAATPLADPRARLAYFGRHARTFRFASRLFPRDALEKVAGVYAFCRFTDDLVDEAPESDPDRLEARLDLWLEMARGAYHQGDSVAPFLRDVMRVARDNGAPFHYVHDLVEGVRMDIRPREYETLAELRTYSYRVASVVGGWLTELFGVHDPWVLERAFALGHAMQLTNILRDVGEDLHRGRLYLPADHLQRFGVDRSLLEVKAREGVPMFPAYRKLLEELMGVADRDYEQAFHAIPALPSFFQGPVAVAARAYQGIHDEIRRNDFDNLTRRARTSMVRKLRLGAGALWSLAALNRAQRKAGLDLRGRSTGLEDSREVTV
jgi:phytoene synthase